jgi:hypothetical protein
MFDGQDFVEHGKRAENTMEGVIWFPKIDLGLKKELEVSVGWHCFSQLDKVDLTIDPL